MTANQSAPSAIACSLDARDFKERVAWIASLNETSLREQRREDLQLILTYDIEALSQVKEMVKREQACCAFLAFDLWEAGSIVELTIKVPDNARDAADVLLEPFHKTSSAAATSTCCGAC